MACSGSHSRAIKAGPVSARLHPIATAWAHGCPRLGAIWPDASRKFPPPWRLSERTQPKISMKDIRVFPCMFLTRTAGRRRRPALVSGAPVGAASGIGFAIAQHSLMEQLQMAAAVSSALTCASTPGRPDRMKNLRLAGTAAHSLPPNYRRRQIVFRCQERPRSGRVKRAKSTS